MRPVAVTQIKDFTVSDDRTQATFTLVTKYAAEITVTIPTSCLDALKVPHGRAPAAEADNSGTTRKGTLHTPKKWLLGAETTKHNIVALVFDPRTEKETGFALNPKAAKDLALGLVKSADAVLAHMVSKTN